MNLAILHYHLNRGGVTRVIENHLASLDAVLEEARPWPAALLFGGRREGFREELPEQLRSIRLSLEEVPALDYDDQLEPGEERDPDELYGQLTAALDRLQFSPRQTLLHFHNHALGKNRHLPAVIPRLAEAGYAVLLQIHDFPEDFRPGNYGRIEKTAAGPYPQASNIHYAVLNGRDEGILLTAGVARERLHRLPNPVPAVDRLLAKADARRRLAERFAVEEDHRFVLYPVRAIRRKNVGEALLYSRLCPPDMVLGLTLPPLNPAEVPIYESWKRLAAELDLPCVFEVGAPGGLTFAENLAAADLILTTSLAEGFGMVFLESWQAGRPLLGRDLPEITCDFTKWGIRLDRLRPQLHVPLEWVGAEAFRRTMTDVYRRTLRAYGREEPADLARRIAEKTAGGWVDFGDLDEGLQHQVLQIVCDSEAATRRLLEHNRWLETSFETRHDEEAETIRHNVETITRHFSLVPSGRRLRDLYRRVSASPRGERPQPLPHRERILDRFLDFDRFRPIRS